MMCVIAFAYKTGRLGPLVLLANRDEYHRRETAPLDWWQDHPGTLGGRDLEGGGSWLAVDSRGRLAAVTNIRDGYPVKARLSRGTLVERFVTGDMTALEFATELAQSTGDYAPYNLLFGQTDDLFHFHSRTGRITRVTPGVHTLSNATLDTPWFKCQRLADQLSCAPRPPSEDDAFEWLYDRHAAPPELLPNTGVGTALERLLSPVFVEARDYGTRASMLLTVSARGDIQFAERSFGLACRETGRRRYTLRPGQMIPPGATKGAVS
ncbi:NRDE family protein [Paludibacterium paludis]|uniref:Transport and Golgi organization protein 2 n=1 Tax=Paludibacterium paludis TaxID=1225769 RepID=A0A918P085_9NEIS|nr:NRDE family protein [Paludibacterium paludis]GGY09377.1 hypothetical protein GCM10011289_10200 [Paludibacterium paludis]